MTVLLESPTVAVRTHTARSRRSKQLRSKVVLGSAGILVFLAIWELAPRVGLIDIRFFPPFSEVGVALLQQLITLTFWVAVGQTMLAWAIGLTIATVSATIIGLIIGTSGFLRRVTRSMIEFLRPIPSVALIPAAVLLFGVKMEAGVLLITYACFWQILVQVLYGTADVDNVLRSTARVYGLGAFARVRHVVIPTMTPFLMTGIRLAATVALVLAITTQMVIGSPGIGQQIVNAQSGAQVPTLYALVAFTGIIGIVVNLLARRVERRVLRWHTSVRSETEQ